MKYVNMGQSCSMLSQMKQHMGYNDGSHIFDWMITDFTGVIQTFKKKEFSVSDFTTERVFFNEYTRWPLRLRKNPVSPPENNEDRGWEQNKLLVECNSFPFVSVHYIEKNKDRDEEMNKFVDMINRRLERIKKYILHENEITFMYYVTDMFLSPFAPNQSDIDCFDEVLRSINPHVNYKLVVFISEQDLEHLKIKPTKEYRILKKIDNSAMRSDWRDGHLDWGYFLKNGKP
jgi:hypothetical protein